MSSKASHSVRGHAKKHTHAAKHVSGKGAKHHPKRTKAAHHVTTQGKPQTVGRTLARARGLAAGAEVACCAAEALAASLRLSGLSVGDGEMLDLFWRAGGDPEAGAPIVTILEAASEFTLAGCRPVFEEVMPNALRYDDRAISGPRATRAGQLLGEEVPDFMPVDIPGLILGLELPGPHTVLATPDGWWSWGELYDPAGFPDAVIEEAWAVTWQ